MTFKLSKVIEWAVGNLLLPWFEKQQAFGRHQYAYGQGIGYKDAPAGYKGCSRYERVQLVSRYGAKIIGRFVLLGCVMRV